MTLSLGAVLFAGPLTPAATAPVGPFVGAPLTLGTSTSIIYEESQLAALPDGTTAAAWVAPGRTSYQIRVRPAGSTTWASTVTTPLDPGFGVDGLAGVFAQPFLLASAGASAFVLVWQETNGSSQRIRAQRLTRAGVAASGPVTLAGPGEVFLTGLATNSAGRAAVVYVTDATTAATTHVVTRATESSNWQLPITVGTVPLPIPLFSALTTGVAVHDSGTVCVMFPTATAVPASPTTLGAVTVKTRCGTPAALSSAPQQTAVTAAIGSVMDLFSVSATITATSSGFLIAALISSTGVVPFPSTSAPPPTAVRVRERPATGGAWSTSATFGLPGEFNLMPRALANPAGVVVHFVRVRGALGSDPATSAFSLDQRVAARQATQAWQPTQTVATLPMDNANTNAALSSGVALGPAGELLVAAPVPVAPSGWTSGFVRRSSWTGAVATSGGLGKAAGPAAVIAASGRVTALGTLPTGDVVVVQSALPKPFVRSAATITTAPRVGTSATCTFAFTDAASITRQWRVNGVVRSTASTYTPKATDRGKTLTCRVTGTNPTGSTVSLSTGRVVT